MTDIDNFALLILCFVGLMIIVGTLFSAANVAGRVEDTWEDLDEN